MIVGLTMGEVEPQHKTPEEDPLIRHNAFAGNKWKRAGGRKLKGRLQCFTGRLHSSAKGYMLE